VQKENGGEGSWTQHTTVRVRLFLHSAIQLDKDRLIAESGLAAALIARQTGDVVVRAPSSS
jgi:hypothetical protein